MNKKQLKRMLERHYTYSKHDKPVNLIDFIIVLNKEIEDLKKKVTSLETKEKESNGN